MRRADYVAVFAGYAGLVEATTIWLAVEFLGKRPVMPLIAFLVAHLGFWGAMLVALLRYWLVIQVVRWEMHYVNAALLIWWSVWSVVNLL